MSLHLDVILICFVAVLLILRYPQSRHVDRDGRDAFFISFWSHLVQDVVVSPGILGTGERHTFSYNNLKK